MNQSDTNPLATALAALMTGHNANPNTSLRIPLVDSNGNLQPGPTLAELASVLGGVYTTISSGSYNDIINSGIYRVGANVIDLPNENFRVQCILNVWRTSTGDIVQFCTRTSQNRHAIRCKSGSTWSPWREI